MTVSSQSQQSARPSGRSGQSLVEIALILPVFLLLLLTALDLGRLLYSQITITNAAKEAALVASQGGTYQADQPCSGTNTVMCGALTEAKGGFVEIDKALVTLSPATCDPTAMYPSSGTPPDVAVSVQAPFRVVTPIIGSFIGDSLVLSATADAQCLVAPRVSYPALPAPTAAFSATPTSGDAPLTVSVDASGSSSPGATIETYAWSFGGAGVTSSTTYSAPGSYTIVLTVTDSRGQTATASQSISVSGPGPSPSCPSSSFTWTKVGSSKPLRVDLEGLVSDPDPNKWTWTWSGGVTGNKQSMKNWDFPVAGSYPVTLTVSRGTCSTSSTQLVTVP